MINIGMEITHNMINYYHHDDIDPISYINRIIIIDMK